MPKETREVVEETVEVPVLFIRLCDQRPSGFILDDGKRGTPDQTQLTAPLARFIPNFGFRQSEKTEIRDGKKVTTKYNEPIRYIKEQMEISVERQQTLQIQRSRAAKEDMIEVRRGEFSVAREGSWIGLYDFLKQAFYNKSNPNRSQRASAIYEEILPGAKEQELNEYDMMLADAIKFIGKFYQRTAKGYSYREEKIDALCELFAVYAETFAGKITALNAMAKGDPKGFLEKAEKFEQTNLANVAHALQLNVIQVKDGVVAYVDKEKMIMHLGSAPMSSTAQIEKIAELLETPDFTAAKEELLFELDCAKEKQLNK